jgi:hypothetical protein
MMRTPTPDAEPPDRLDAALRAAFQAQVAAMDAALGRQGRALHSSIHAARKAGRRARAILALWGPELPRELASADRRLRALTRRFSRLRDAHVAVEQAAALHADAEQAGTLQRLRDTLQRRRDHLAADMLEDDPRLRRCRERVRRIGTELAALSWPKRSRKQVQAALKRAERRSAKAAAGARATPGAPSLHRWRRRLRQRRLQREALRQIAHAAGTAPRARAAAARLAERAADREGDLDALTALADTLGAQRDRELLRNAIRRHVPTPWRAAALALCKGAIRADGAPAPRPAD